MKNKRDHIVFSIATNGYEKHFRDCLESQINYCRELGVPHVLLTGAPPWSISAADSAWLKIPMMRYLLGQVKKGVLYLDADCEVMPGSPDFRNIGGSDLSGAVYACHDFSHRINSAVLYARNTRVALKAFRRLSMASFLPVQFLPREDRNLYENGHVIWFFKSHDGFRLLPREWNHGVFDGKEGAYIFHHGGTEFRQTQKSIVANTPGWREKVREALVGFRLIAHMTYFKRRVDPWQ